MTEKHSLFEAAVAALTDGDFVRAEAIFKKILSKDPLNIDALNYLTLTLMSVSRYAEAESYIARSVSLDRRSDVSFYNYGVILLNLKKTKDAVTQFDAALRLNSRVPETWNNRGIAFYELGEYKNAAFDFDKAAKINLLYFEAHYNKGKALFQAGSFDEAIGSYNVAITLMPGSSSAYKGRGGALSNLSRLDEALADYDKAISLAPDDAESHSNRGVVLRELGRYDDAIRSFDKAISISPEFAEAYSNRGLTFKDLRRFDRALDDFGKALSISPNFAEAFSNRGTVFHEIGRFADALSDYNKALDLRSNFAEARQNRSYTELVTGNFQDGWADYEFRRGGGDRVPHGLSAIHALKNLDNVAGKNILIHWEQGLGDTIQFCRYLKLLKERGATVYFEPQKSLKKLMSTMNDGINIVSDAIDPKKFQYRAPLLGLPKIFGTGPSTIPTNVPYLKADEAKVDYWKKKIGSSGLKIGIAWHASRLGVRTGRTFPLSCFEKIVQVPSVRLISLQKNDDVETLECGTNTFSVESLGDDFDSGPDAFLDTAAVMMNLDLIISADTSIVHLAGALARPTWIALKYVPDWRWLMDISYSPWYPTVRLFRQQSVDDWQSAFTQIEKALKTSLGNA